MTGFKRLIREPGFRYWRSCNLCRLRAAFFYKFGHKSEVFKEPHIIGGGVRKNCECPYCRSHDRFHGPFT